MATPLTVHQAVKAAIRATGGTVIDWTKSPFCLQVPDKPPPFPYVVFDVAASSELEVNFEDSYTEKFVVTVTVWALEINIEALSSPFVTGSVIRYLDTLQAGPVGFDALSGVNFTCINFIRQPGWRMDFEPALRASSSERAWYATAHYGMTITSRFGAPPV